MGLLELFLTNGMIDKLVIYTNASIQPLLEKFEDLPEDSDKNPHFKLIDWIDMKAFIGILYLPAAFRLNLLDREIIWNHQSAHDIFGATMSVNWFKFICRFCTFDDKTTHQDRWKNDKFACMQDIFEAMNATPVWGIHWLCWLFMRLFTHTGVILASNNIILRNRWSMVCYIEVFVTLQLLILTSAWLMLANQRLLVETGQSFTSPAQINTWSTLVNWLSCYTSIQGCNISMDRYFTLVFWAEWAL